MKPQTFILIGRSGCGKGTQAKLLKEHLEKARKDAAAPRPVYYFEVGNHFRDFWKGDSYASKLSQAIYKNDELQPGFLAVHMWSENFLKDLTGEEHLIIDGASRSILEAEVLDNALEFYGRKANIIYLEVGRHVAQARLLARGRADDANADRISKRLNWYERDTVPVIEYYKNHSVHNFLNIDGEKTVPEVQADIIEKMKVFG